MKAKLKDGTYYEIVGGLSEDYIKKVEDSDFDDNGAKLAACDTERCAYKNTYKDGKRIKSIKLYDPYNDEYFPVNTDKLYYEPLPYDMRFAYSMLGRLKSDCDYVLGNGGKGAIRQMWAGNIDEQIAEMRKRWNAFADDEKPEWLTMEQIDEYERRLMAL